MDDMRLALLSIGDNAFWLWLRGAVGARAEYLRTRLRQAGNWDEFCFINGQLDALEQLMKQVKAIENGEGGEASGFFATDGGL